MPWRKRLLLPSSCGGPAGRSPLSGRLAVVAAEVAACTRCAELARTRTQTVFGVGNPYARLVFCGEAPGADEDRQGEPFVGRAGQLLTDIIVKGMKMRREDVYILNILRCRPPGNRTPAARRSGQLPRVSRSPIGRSSSPSSSAAWGPWRPRTCWAPTPPSAGCAAGCTTITASKSSAPTIPPIVLRNPQAKRPVWDDIQMLMAEMKKNAES